MTVVRNSRNVVGDIMKQLLCKESILKNGIVVNVGKSTNLDKSRISRYLKDITGDLYGIDDNVKNIEYMCYANGALRGLPYGTPLAEDSPLVSYFDFIQYVKHDIKGQLEDGMRVLTEDGTKLWKCGSFFTNGHMKIDIAEYRINLEHAFRHLNIVKIFAANDFSGDVIYERPEKVKVTLGEIAHWKGVSKDRIEIEGL